MVQPTEGEPMKLHAYWDSLLGHDATPAEAIAASHDLPTPDTTEVGVSIPALWIIGSFTIAQNDIYTGLIGPGAGPFNLTKDYEARALQTARERAALAGARLPPPERGPAIARAQAVPDNRPSFAARAKRPQINKQLELRCHPPGSHPLATPAKARRMSEPIARKCLP